MRSVNRQTQFITLLTPSAGCELAIRPLFYVNNKRLQLFKGSKRAGAFYIANETQQNKR